MAIRIAPTPPPHPKFRRAPGAAPEPQQTLFEQLLPVSWRGIAFPVTSMRFSLRQDLAEHKYYGVDGASVEPTGRAPIEIEAVIPFVNGIVPGKGESWGVLYPTTFREFVKSISNHKTGILVHPELGEITCKPVSLDVNHDAQQRDGVTVTAKWLETVLAFDDAQLAVGDSPIKEAQRAALDLDASKTDLLALVPEAEWQDETFESLVNKATSVFDSVSSTATLLQNKPRQILYRVNRLKKSIERTRNVLTWPAEEALSKLESAWNQFKPGTKVVYGTGGAQTVAVNQNRAVGRYVTPTRMTASALSATLGASIEDLIELNPALVGRPEVSANTVIRIYE